MAKRRGRESVGRGGADGLAGVFILCVLSLVLCVPPIVAAHAQSGRQPGRSAEDSPAADEEVIRVRTDEVLLPVTVRDARGRPVEGIEEEKFFVYD
ncbi:MAG: hypothetical protein ACRD68_12930, partial [Pyrinomonadaceae bacterium]